MYQLKEKTKNLFERVLNIQLPSFLDYNIIHQAILPALIDIHCNEIDLIGNNQESFVSLQIQGSNNYNWITWNTGDICVSGTLQELVPELETLILNIEHSEKRRVIVEYAPISERMWSKGEEATILNGKIQLSGCWFDFDDRYVVKSCN